MLTESAPPVVDAALLDEIGRHLRLGDAFAAEEADALRRAFRAALSHLEATLGLCLVPRSFVWRGRLGVDGAARGPIGPVVSLTSVDRVRTDGGLTPLDISRFWIDRTETRTRICSRFLVGDELEVRFDAGFGTDWSATPADLRQAALMLAAHYYDVRHAAGERLHGTPLGVASLIQPWRTTRVTLGGAA